MEQRKYDNLTSRINRVQLLDKQKRDFDLLVKLFENYIFSMDSQSWIEIIKKWPDVIKKCDEIDYKGDCTAVAYAIWHFLDRYHRFQIIISMLHDMELLCVNRGRDINILDIGTGPSHTLFALSDYYSSINEILNSTDFSMKLEYVEQSDGFKQFLHRFVEPALVNGKRYYVPFHFAKADNAFDFSINDEVFSEKYWGNRYIRYSYRVKSRYDITVMNNFLTNIDMVRDFVPQLKKICRYMRNNGLLIVIGSSDKNDKYSEIYKTIEKIVGKRFKDNYFRGYWTKVYDGEMYYKYDDYYGEKLREYQKCVVDFLENSLDANNKILWDYVEKAERKKFESTISQTPEKTAEEGWEGICWKVLILQKHSSYVRKA